MARPTKKQAPEKVEEKVAVNMIDTEVVVEKEAIVKEIDKEEEVLLIGAPNELQGEHTIMMKKGTIRFTDGKAKVKSSVAEILRKEGLIT